MFLKAYRSEQRKKLSRRSGGAFSCSERGSVLFYIFIAIGLLGALTYAFVKDSREGTSSQMSFRVAEDVYVQVNTIRASIVECTVEYPGGGGDIDGDGDIDATDNPNSPYPVNPSHPDNPHGVAADDKVKNLSCTGAPAGKANIFQGAQNRGRFLPPPPTGFGDWEYINDADGVRIRIITTSDAAALAALPRVMSRFATCQADLDYDSCGAGCFTAWLQRTACP